ncbi:MULTISPECIES: hypothetical protein [Paenibacillus]|uniref:hypothetical protein n=1 Tax=Paenibacillus TaxID=44249 RepID=UPI0022B8CF26|nr:hypothetical protein [Paenibacillus caseinilyticus]
MDYGTRRTFQALVDAILPPVCGCAAGAVPTAGAVQLGVDLFVMEELDRSQFVPADEKLPPAPLTESTARLLDIGAGEWIRRMGMPHPISGWMFPAGGIYAALPRADRLQTLALLDRVQVPLHLLPPPYHNNPGMVQTMVDSLHQLTMFGYYSEWVGYGTTRLRPPGSRRLEFEPPGWRLAGYPGPSYGYRALRGWAGPSSCRGSEGSTV